MKKVLASVLSLIMGLLALAIIFPAQVQATEGQGQIDVRLDQDETVDVWQVDNSATMAQLNNWSAQQLTDRYDHRQVEATDQVASFTTVPLGLYYGRVQSVDSNRSYQSFLLRVEGDQETVVVQPKYQLATGQVLLQKLGRRQAETQPLEGVLFRLYEAHTHRPYRVLHGQATTDQAGTYDLLTDAEGQLKVSHLPVGDYYFVEIQPLAGYQLLDDPIPFSIIAHQQTELTVDNFYQAWGHRRFKLVNPDGQPLQGGRFLVIGPDGQPVQRDGRDYIVTSDWNGHLTVTDLPYGSYQLKQIQAPDGYQMTDQLVAFDIDPYSFEKDHYQLVVNHPLGQVQATPPSLGGRPPTLKDWTQRPLKSFASLPKTGQAGVLLVTSLLLIGLGIGIRTVFRKERPVLDEEME